MRPLLVLAIVYLLAKIVDCRAVENDTDENERGKRRHKFSVEDLLNAKFPRIITGDLDIDICKAGGFLGDIALPNVKYDTEWREQKLNKSYLEELKKYREEILKEGLQVEEEGLTEILQFKSEHDANKQMFHEHDQIVAREKSEPTMINRNQYSTDDESDDGFSFSTRNDDTNPAVKDEGFEFRLEFSTQASKKRYSGQQAHRQLTRRTSISKSVTARQSNDDVPLEFSTPTALTHEDNKYVGRIHTGGVKEIFTAQPETSTQSVANRRRRRHQRRR